MNIHTMDVLNHHKNLGKEDQPPIFEGKAENIMESFRRNYSNRSRARILHRKILQRGEYEICFAQWTMVLKWLLPIS